MDRSAIARIVLKQARTKESAPEEPKAEGKNSTIKAAEPEFSHIIETYPLTERELEVLENRRAGLRAMLQSPKSCILLSVQ